jgi:hypothetical protein
MNRKCKRDDWSVEQMDDTLRVEREVKEGEK